MEIHRPKLFHGSRELTKELGIIVIGVLIALGGEQTVGWLHQRVEVAEARQALRSEIAANARLARYSIEEERCFSRALDRTVRWANGGARVPLVSGRGLFAFSTTTWDVVKAGAAEHMPLKERLAYSSFYSGVLADEKLLDYERPVYQQLVGFSAMTAISPADAQLILQYSNRARFLGFVRSADAVGMIQAAKNLGVDPLPFTAFNRETLARDCAMGAEPASAPKP